MLRLLLGSFLLFGVLNAADPTGTLTGTVLDPGGALVPGTSAPPGSRTVPVSVPVGSAAFRTPKSKKDPRSNRSIVVSFCYGHTVAKPLCASMSEGENTIETSL